MKLFKKISAAVLSLALAAFATSCTDNDRYEEHQWADAATTLPGTWKVLESTELSTLNKHLNEEYFEEKEVSATLYPRTFVFNDNGTGVFNFDIDEKQEVENEDGTKQTVVVKVPQSVNFAFAYDIENETISVNLPETDFFEAMSFDWRAVISSDVLYLYVKWPSAAAVLRKQ